MWIATRLSSLRRTTWKTGTPSFSVPSSDGGANSITIPGHGFAAGAEVIYTAEGTALDPLMTGNRYFVIHDPSNPDVIKLALTYDEAVGRDADTDVAPPVTAIPITPIDLMPSVVNADRFLVHSLRKVSDQPLGGLNDGRTYYVANALTFAVSVDTATAGSKFGTVSFGTNEADEAPFSFNLTADVSSVLVIDNVNAGYSEPDGPLQRWISQGFRGTDGVSDVNEGVIGGALQTAVWTFDDLPAGSYLVSTTWTPYYSRASNATYAITGDSLTNAVVNQKRSPTDALSNVAALSTTSVLDGITFRDLAMVTITGSTITISLSDATANGNINADAVRIERLGPLQVEVAGDPWPAAAPANAGRLSLEAIDPLMQAAVQYWTDLDASAAARLEDVQVAVEDLPGTVLGFGSSVTPTIWLDDDAAGYGWQLDEVGGEGGEGGVDGEGGENFGQAVGRGRRPAPSSEGPAPSSEVLAPSIEGPAFSIGLSHSGIDLLTVITHELGHVLGYPDLRSLDEHNHVMADTLPVGRRRVSDQGPADLPAPSDLTVATYRSAAEHLFDQYALRDLLVDLDGGDRRSEDRHNDQRRALDPVKLSDLGARLRPQSDDRPLKPARDLLDQDQEDSRDAYFSEFGEQHGDQKEGPSEGL